MHAAMTYDSSLVDEWNGIREAALVFARAVDALDAGSDADNALAVSWCNALYERMDCWRLAIHICCISGIDKPGEWRSARDAMTRALIRMRNRRRQVDTTKSIDMYVVDAEQVRRRVLSISTLAKSTITVDKSD